MNILETDRQAVADKRAEAASLEMRARRLHREADEIERFLNLARFNVDRPLSLPSQRIQRPHRR